MARLIAEQLRPVVVAWLLLTLPVICHHQTAVVLLNAITSGDAHAHRAQTHATLHADHESAPVETKSGLAAVTQSSPSEGREWCAHHPNGSTGAALQAQDGFTVAPLAGIAEPLAPPPLRRCVDPTTPDDLHRPPPQPPPRLLV